MQLNLGLDALSIASANIFIELDASAKLGLNFSAGTTVQLAGSPVYGDIATSTDAATTAALAAQENASNGDGEISFDGCIDLVGSVAANAGADASFFDLFSADTTVPIFSEEFELFKVGRG